MGIPNHVLNMVLNPCPIHAGFGEIFSLDKVTHLCLNQVRQNILTHGKLCEEVLIDRQLGITGGSEPPCETQESCFLGAGAVSMVCDPLAPSRRILSSSLTPILGATGLAGLLLGTVSWSSRPQATVDSPSLLSGYLISKIVCTYCWH